MRRGAMLDYRGQFADLIQRSAAALAASSKTIARLLQEKRPPSSLSAVPPGNGAGGESPWMENTTGYLQERIKRLEKEIHMLNSKGRMMEVQCDMLTQQEDELRKSFDRILTWLGFLGVALVLAGIVEWAGVTNLVGEHLARRFKRMCDASCESRIEIIKSCPS